MSPDKLSEACRVDRVLDELITDYQTLLSALRAHQDNTSETSAQFWSDSLEALHALDGEIRSRLSLLDQNEKKEGKL